MARPCSFAPSRLLSLSPLAHSYENGLSDKFPRAAFRRATGSDIERSSVSEDQTEVNIRERAGGRKQKSFRTYMVVRVDPDQVLELR